MAKLKSTLRATSGQEPDLSVTIREVIQGKTPIDSLLENAEFVKRTRKICRLYASREWQNEYDHEDLFQDLCVVLFKRQSLPQNLDSPYEYSLFRWLRAVVRNLFRDRIRKNQSLRRRHVREEVSVDSIDLPDPSIDIERQFHHEELRTQFLKSIASQPIQRRVAIALYISGHSPRDIAEILNQQGMKCSHPTVYRWIKEVQQELFREASTLIFPEKLRISRESKERFRIHPSR
jgi:RNA polymerase sigma factor (sigma-70 family)